MAHILYGEPVPAPPGHALAGRLAAAGVVDLFLERRKADGADHHLAADHVARRAVESELLGELEALLDARSHLVAADVALDPRHVEADLLRRRERAGPIHLAASGQQLLVKL